MPSGRVIMLLCNLEDLGILYFTTCRRVNWFYESHESMTLSPRHSIGKNTMAGSIVWGLGFALENIFGSMNKRKDNCFWANFGTILFGQTLYIQYMYS